MPGDVASGEPQELVQWLSRAGFFILVGQVSGWLLAPTVRHPLAEEVRRLGSSIDSLSTQAGRVQVGLPAHPIDQAGTACRGRALIRWEDPVRGTIPPVEFIGVAEETDLIQESATLCLRKPADKLRWRSLAESGGIEPWHVAVNLSARDMAARNWPCDRRRTEASQTASGTSDA